MSMGGGAFGQCIGYNCGISYQDVHDYLQQHSPECLYCRSELEGTCFHMGYMSLNVNICTSADIEGNCLTWANPHCCGFFGVCGGSDALTMNHCPPGLIFNPNMLTCDFPSFVDIACCKYDGVDCFE